MPKIISIEKKIGKSNVDETASIELMFSDNMYSCIEVAIRKRLKNQAFIEGSKGDLKITNPVLPDNNFFLELVLRNNKKEILNYIFMVAYSVQTIFLSQVTLMLMYLQIMKTARL
jgi:hypothetical protein